jgi:hypothetical protein
MAVSPFCDTCAFGTETGVFAVNLIDLACTTSTVTTVPGPIGDMTWNTRTGELYVTSGSSVVVLRQPL